MAVRKQIPYTSGIFFITFTCTQWLPLFQLTNSYYTVYNWFDYLISKGHFINAYVIMPNHVHAIISFSETKKSINKIIGDGKRFMSYEIVKILEANNNEKIIAILQHAVNKTDLAKGKKHEVFEPSLDWKKIETENFMQQKLDYIHQNPIKCVPSLCKQSTEYKHSSASNYELLPTVEYAPITFIHEMLDKNLTNNKYGL